MPAHSEAAIELSKETSEFFLGQLHCKENHRKDTRRMHDKRIQRKKERKKEKKARQSRKHFARDHSISLNDPQRRFSYDGSRCFSMTPFPLYCLMTLDLSKNSKTVKEERRPWESVFCISKTRRTSSPYPQKRFKERKTKGNGVCEKVHSLFVRKGERIHRNREHILSFPKEKMVKGTTRGREMFTCSHMRERILSSDRDSNTIVCVCVCVSVRVCV